MHTYTDLFVAQTKTTYLPYLILSILLGSCPVVYGMTLSEKVASREEFNAVISKTDEDLLDFIKYMGIYDKLTHHNEVRSDVEELLDLTILEYLTELDIAGHSGIRLFFLRHYLTDCKPFIVTSLKEAISL